MSRIIQVFPGEAGTAVVCHDMKLRPLVAWAVVEEEARGSGAGRRNVVALVAGVVLVPPSRTDIALDSHAYLASEVPTDVPGQPYKPKPEGT